MPKLFDLLRLFTMFLAFVVITRDIPVKGNWWHGILGLLVRYTAAVVLAYLALKRKW